MKKALLIMICLLVLGMGLPARADVGRDILIIHRTTNNWTWEDLVTTIQADGTRLVFDLAQVPHEIRNDPDELLYFLRLHALSDTTTLYGAAAPLALPSLTQEQAAQVRVLLGRVVVVPFAETQHMLDAGNFLTYAVVRVEGEATLALLSRAGNFQGVTTDPASLELLALAGPWLMGE